MGLPRLKVCRLQAEQTQLLLSGQRLLLLLEGGYSLQGLSEGVAESIGAITGEAPCHVDAAGITEPLEHVAACVASLQALHGLLEAR